jgi:hypothetical protein
MGIFKKKPAKPNITMHGYENGKEVSLRHAEPDKDVWKSISVSKNVNEHIKPLEDAIVGLAVELKRRHTVDDEIKLSEAIIDNYQALKEKCYSMGRDYSDYFERTWENARAGRPDGPSYINRFVTRLKYLQDNYGKLRSAEK